MGRLSCIVPFCRRTTPRTEFDEWLCGDHWRLVRHERRRAYGRHVRQWRRYGTFEDPAKRLWNAIKREATERAGGI